jgi:hypothetical protein
VKKFVAILSAIITITIIGCSSHKVRYVEPEIVVETNSSESKQREVDDKNDTIEVSKAYLPTVKIDPKFTTYVKNTKELQKAIDEAKEGDTIILKEGSYSGVYIADKKHLTIKSEKLHKASFSIVDPSYIHGKNALKIVNSSYINILGLESKNFDYFIFAPTWKAPVHHIYIADCLVHDQKAAIYSGRSSYDWTVDRSQFYNLSRYSAWSALGHHHTLQNSKLSKINNFYLTIRGYAPIGEVNKGKYPKFDKPPLRERKKGSYQRLHPSDWTHYVVNNVFGETIKGCHEDEGTVTAIGFYINTKNAKDHDAYLLPPQNVVIENNIFYKNHKNGAIFANRVFGFSKEDIDEGYQILGTVIKDNITDAKTVITLNREPDLSMIEMSGNKKEVNASKILKMIK